MVSGEESVSQVRLRAERMGALHEQLYLAAESDLGAVLGHLDAVKPGLLVLDSVQTISAPGTEGVPGGVTQVRAVTAALVAVAKERGIATVLVGHVTKDGQVAGPRVLEHLVDVVLHFEGDKHSSLRMVRGVKNRFGAADEVGCFEMHEGGITSLADPSGLFLTRYAEPVPGTCVTVAMEGRRALVTEVQALIGATVAGLAPAHRVRPRRAPGWRWCWPCCSAAPSGCTLHDREVFAATVGGIRVVEPAADLAVALAVASGGLNLAIAPAPGGDRRGGADRRGAPGRRGAAGGWPRRPGSASGSPWCRPAAARPRPAQRRRACGWSRSATSRLARCSGRPGRRPSDRRSGSRA